MKLLPSDHLYNNFIQCNFCAKTCHESGAEKMFESGAEKMFESKTNPSKHICSNCVKTVQGRK